MITTDWLPLSTFANFTSVGASWDTPDNAKIEDSLLAIATETGASVGAEPLRTKLLSGIGIIGLVSPLKVYGVEARFKRYLTMVNANGTDSAYSTIQLVVDNNLQVPTKSSAYWTLNTLTWSPVYGGPTDTWGLPSPLVITDPSKFGVAVRGAVFSVYGTYNWHVDCIQVRITYDPSSGFFFD